MGVQAAASTSERVVKDTAKQFAAQLAVGAFAVFFSAWLNRMLPEKELALWPICTSVGAVVSAVSSFGMGDSFLRLVPALIVTGERAQASGILKTGLLINLLACAILSLCVYLFPRPLASLLLHDAGEAPHIRQIAFAAFLMALSERLNWVQQSVQQFGKKALINLISGTLRNPLAVALCVLLGDGRGVILALTVIPLLSTVLSAVWLRKFIFTRGPLAEPVKLLRYSLSFYGVSLVGLLSGRVNTLVVALLAPLEVVATFFVAGSIAGYVDALNKFAIASVAPKLSEKGALTPDNLDNVFTKCTRYAFLGLLPIHVLIAVAAAPLVQLYGGHKYADAWPLLVVMCAGLFAGVLYQLHRVHIQIFAKPVHLLGLSLCQGVANIAALAALVPPLGAMGAALSDTVVDSFQALVSWRVLHRTIRVLYDWRAVVTAVKGAALAAAVLWLAHPLWEYRASPVLPALVVAGLVYALALYRSLDPEDAGLLLRLIPGGLRQTQAGARLSSFVERLWVNPGRSS